MELQKRYKILYEKEKCIGAGSCTVAYPQRWLMNKEGDRAELIGGILQSDGRWIAECTEEELKRFLESAQMCPVNVIHIIEIKTGKKII